MSPSRLTLVAHCQLCLDGLHAETLRVRQTRDPGGTLAGILQLHAQGCSCKRLRLLCSAGHLPHGAAWLQQRCRDAGACPSCLSGVAPALGSLHTTYLLSDAACKALHVFTALLRRRFSLATCILAPASYVPLALKPVKPGGRA